jgi:hypothetical protein
VGVEYFNNILPASAKSHLRTSNALPNIPIPPPKRRRVPIQGILEHGALFNRPAGQDGEPAAKRAAVIELAVGQDLAGAPADGAVVVLDPAFLEADDVRDGDLEGDLAADLVEARGAEGGDVEEAPAVEGEEVDGCRALAGVAGVV